MSFFDPLLNTGDDPLFGPPAPKNSVVATSSPADKPRSILFEDDADSADLFSKKSPVVAKVSSTLKTSPPVSSTTVASDEVADDFFAPKSATKVTPSAPSPTVPRTSPPPAKPKVSAASLFGDTDEKGDLFGRAKTSSAAGASLFGAEEDSSLFGTAKPQPTAVPVTAIAAKTTLTSSSSSSAPVSIASPHLEVPHAHAHVSTSPRHQNVRPAAVPLIDEADLFGTPSPAKAQAAAPTATTDAPSSVASSGALVIATAAPATRALPQPAAAKPQPAPATAAIPARAPVTSMKAVAAVIKPAAAPAASRVEDDEPIFGRATDAPKAEEDLFMKPMPTSGAPPPATSIRKKPASVFEAEDDLDVLKRESDLSAVYLPKDPSRPTVPAATADPLFAEPTADELLKIKAAKAADLAALEAKALAASRAQPVVKDESALLKKLTAAPVTFEAAKATDDDLLPTKAGATGGLMGANFDINAYLAKKENEKKGGLFDDD